jgi:hypothetical protein
MAVMKRAVELFDLETRSSGSPLVEETWQSWSEPEESFISVAATHWEMVVTWPQTAAACLTVRGPETRATIVPIPQGAEFFGIQFGVGTFMPGLPPGRLVDRSVTLPAAGGSFWLAGSAWELPSPDTADVFVDKLASAGLLVHDPVVADALDGDVEGFSTRSLERRVARAMGLSRGAVERIRRAQRAVTLLSRGMPASEVARQSGYADQSHLTRSLRRFVGQTPSQIASSATSG